MSPADRARRTSRTGSKETPISTRHHRGFGSKVSAVVVGKHEERPGRAQGTARTEAFAKVGRFGVSCAICGGLHLGRTQSVCTVSSLPHGNGLCYTDRVGRGECSAPDSRNRPHRLRTTGSYLGRSPQRTRPTDPPAECQNQRRQPPETARGPSPAP